MNQNDKRREYNPAFLLDQLAQRMNLNGDRGLSVRLNIAKMAIDGIRHKELSVDPTMLILMHEVSGISTSELRSLMGDRRKAFRISYQYSHKKRGNDELGTIPAKEEVQPQAKEPLKMFQEEPLDRNSTQSGLFAMDKKRKKADNLHQVMVNRRAPSSISPNKR